MSSSDKHLNFFEPALIERAQIDPVDLRTIVWENQNPSVMTCQLIVVSLSMGVLTFAGYAFFQAGPLRSHAKRGL